MKRRKKQKREKDGPGQERGGRRRSGAETVEEREDESRTEGKTGE